MNDAGRIGFLIKGTYDNTATYDFLDAVYYNNATYVAKKLTVGNKPQSSSEFWQVLMDGEVNFNDIAPTFTQAETRANINSGEKISVLFGKIKKYFADLKTVAFSGSYTDLSNKPTASDIGAVATSKVLDTTELISNNTVSGNVAGALAVKAINNNFQNSLNKIGNIYTGKGTEITISGAYLEEPISEYITLPSGTYIFVINYGGDIVDGRYLLLTLTEQADNGEYYHINNWTFNGKPANVYGKDCRTFVHVAKLSINNRKYNVRIGTNWQSDTDVNKASATLTAVRIA